ncbi:MAG: DNA topoisomerase [Chloroflexota bacterium]|nr:MAG: DNA topoisomerase [Chloroflexota bacterium]
MRTLIIVESPHKARSVTQYARTLFPGKTVVRSCLGHLRDLPPGKLGVVVEENFRPLYETRRGRKKTVSYLRQEIMKADRVILSTDPDREGEAVAWHITKIFETELKGKRLERAPFNAVTRDAVREALLNPRPLDTKWVKAAIARRVMDRLVGYTISPRLWAAVKGKNLSAGRVQTVALRLLIKAVDRANAKPESWTVEVEI